jgi:hypothetical protein
MSSHVPALTGTLNETSASQHAAFRPLSALRHFSFRLRKPCLISIQAGLRISWQCADKRRRKPERADLLKSRLAELGGVLKC